MYLLSSHSVTLAERRIKLSPIIALGSVDIRGQILSSVTPSSKAILIPSLIVSPGRMQTNGKLCPQTETFLVYSVCSRVQRSRACLGSSLWGGAGCLGHTVGQACLGCALYCFYQPHYNLLNTWVNAKQDQLVTALPLDGINERNGNKDTENIFLSHSK